MTFKSLSFDDILKEERLREYNRCHVPGGPGGGQFCSTDGGDFKNPKFTPPTRASANYYGVHFDPFANMSGPLSGSARQRRQRANIIPLPGSSGPVGPKPARQPGRKRRRRG